MPKPVLVRASALALALLAAAPACSSGSDDDAASVADETVDQPTDEGGAGETGAGGGTGSDGSDPASLAGRTPLSAARSLIRTAELSLTVDDVTAAASGAVAAAEAVGGFQSGGSLELDEPRSGFVELRVPADRFREVFDAVAGLGDLADQRVATEDVTDQVVDLDARIAAARISVDRVRGFLDRTGNVADLAAVERELTARESALEALLGQQRVLADQVELATITARFGEEEPPALAADPEPSDDIPGFARALRYGWVAVVNGFKVVAAATGFALPFTVIALPVVMGVRVVRRRRAPVPTA
jgi:hypothetical protein